jgi:quercetin dioxygenase-like cupin family protein
MIVMLLALLSPCSAYGSWEGSEGILIQNEELDGVRYDDYIRIFDVMGYLDYAGNLSLTSDMSVQVITIENGGVLSPDGILPAPEVLYVTCGTLMLTVNDEEFQAEKGDAVYIPSKATRRYANEADETVCFFSVTDQLPVPGDEESLYQNETKNQEDPVDITHVISENMVTGLELGSKELNQSFHFSRLIHPLEGPYNTGFDLGTIRIFQGFGIPDHYVDGRYQLMTVLSGSGTISIGCHDYQVGRNDIIYVAPGAVMSAEASEEMELMILVNPYYQEKFDKEIPYACDYLY